MGTSEPLEAPFANWIIPKALVYTFEFKRTGNGKRNFKSNLNIKNLTSRGLKIGIRTFRRGAK